MAVLQAGQVVEVESGTNQGSRKIPVYRVLWVQVLIAMTLAVILGYLNPARAVAMKPLGDAFIRLITMIVSLIIFCTVVTGIAGMESLKKVGRVGGMALLYFEVVSTIALLIGLAVGNVVHPGSGFNVNVATLDAKSVADYAGQAKAQTVTEFSDAHHPDHCGGWLRQRGHSRNRVPRVVIRLRSGCRRLTRQTSG